MKYILTLIIFFTGLSIDNLYSKGKLEMSVGIGAPEFYNLKIRYGNNFMAGICAGAYLGPGLFGKSTGKQGSFSGEIYYHFTGKTKYGKQHLWYLLAGFGHYKIPIVDKYGLSDLGFYPRIGRTFNFSGNAGITFDIGAYLPLSELPGYNHTYFQILPSGNAGLFIRF